MIAGKVKQVRHDAKPGKGYSRTKAQRKDEDFTEKGDIQCGYDLSDMNAPSIQYNTTGDKL